MSSLVPETQWAQGASGVGNVYDTSPAGLGLSPAYLSSATASASSASSTTGTHANRPATASAGATYWETDTKNLFLFDGSAWQSITAHSWLVDIDAFPTAISQVNWDSIGVSSSAAYNGFKQNNSSQNSEINWDIFLGSGTWTVELIHVKENDAGIATVQLSSDAGATFTSVGSAPYSGSASTIDFYNAPQTYNNRSTITAVTITATGLYRMKLLMATKNGSSSNYFAGVQHVQWRRTA